MFLAPKPGEKGDGSSVAVYASDAEGLAWRFLSYVGRADELQWSGEGPNESTLVLLADGKNLLCIMRCATTARLPLLSPLERLRAGCRAQDGRGGRPQQR